MSRVDVPTLKCDRCLALTQDLNAMGRYVRLIHPKPSGGNDGWDLCPDCWHAFRDFLSEG